MLTFGAVDPEAARAVFSNTILAAKTTLITLDLTHQCLATKTVRQNLHQGSTGTTKLPPSQLRQLLSEILEFFASSYDEFFDIKEGPPLHDPLAVAVLFGFDKSTIFEDDPSERYSVSVVTAGEHSDLDSVRGQVGRTVVKRIQSHTDGVCQGVRIPRRLNVDAFWQVLEDCCLSAEESAES